MKMFSTILTVILFTVATLHAQVVNDGATSTLSNVTNFYTSDVTVGTNGSFTLLVLSDNTLLTNSANVIIGRNSTARSNEVRLISSSARWLMGGLFAFPTVYLGSNGAFNRLVVSNGATMRAFFGNVGFQVSASNNLALVTGPGSVWSMAGLTLGSSGAGNQMIISNGGVLDCASSTIGVASSNNLAVVTGSGSTWTNENNLTVGLFGAGNQLLVREGGAVLNALGSLGSDTTSSNNVALITGAGSLWSNRADLIVGNAGSASQLVVSNGAWVFASRNGVIGANSSASSNSVTLSGIGSSWTVLSNLFVGSNGALSRLLVSDGAWVANNSGVVGNGVLSSNNLALVTGAGSSWSNRTDVFVGFASGDNRLVVSNGGAVFTAGNGVLGLSTGANANATLLTDTDSRWLIATNLYVGSNGMFNQLVVSNGAAGQAIGFGILGANSGANSNMLVVDGPGSSFTSSTNLLMVGASVVVPALYVGSEGSFNRLIVTNGGFVNSGLDSYIGHGGGSSNEVVVTGPGSRWITPDGYLTLGISSPGGNRLVITNGGSVQVGYDGYIGYVGGSNNEVVVTGPGSSWSNGVATHVGPAGAV